MSAREVRVPDIGEFEDVEVIELLVAAGDEVAAEQSLITLESDKATMEIPSPAAGRVAELCVEVGSRVSEGDLILRLEAAESAGEDAAEDGDEKAAKGREEEAASAEDERGGAEAPEPPRRAPAAAKAPPAELPEADLRAQVLVLGAGPGGYTAAFRAADLGLDVVLVERYEALGGVCLNVGCIPSKALLHVAEVIAEARALADHGVAFGEPSLDLAKLRDFKDGVVGRLTGGLSQLAKRRKVRVVRGEAAFEGPHLLRVRGDDGETRIAFEHGIVAAGSRAVRLPGLPDDPRVLDSTSALELREVPERLLVVGGGIIGLEMAAVYHGLGSRVTVVELLDRLMTGADADLVKALRKVIDARYEAILLGTKVSAVAADGEGLEVAFEGEGAPEPQRFDAVLVAVGRRANGDRIGAEAAGLEPDERGVLAVDGQMRTAVPHLFAIGDVTEGPQLAHKAMHQGKVAAEVIAGQKVAFEPVAIPSVAYTDPEVAWVGLTEEEARRRGVEIEKASFPWSASGRALGVGRPEGLTKLVLEPGTRRLLGAGLVGPNAGELVGELVLALEMAADAEDLALSIHPHPTLSETVGLAAEMAHGSITDLYVRRRS